MISEGDTTSPPAPCVVEILMKHREYFKLIIYQLPEISNVKNHER